MLKLKGNILIANINALLETHPASCFLSLSRAHRDGTFHPFQVHYPHSVVCFGRVASIHGVPRGCSIPMVQPWWSCPGLWPGHLLLMDGNPRLVGTEIWEEQSCENVMLDNCWKESGTETWNVKCIIFLSVIFCFRNTVLLYFNLVNHPCFEIIAHRKLASFFLIL